MREEAPIFVGWIAASRDREQGILSRENQIVSQD